MKFKQKLIYILLILLIYFIFPLIKIPYSFNSISNLNDEIINKSNKIKVIYAEPKTSIEESFEINKDKFNSQPII
ncbi:hypothetical protein [Faecalimicrobium sp. JNUCC 81]